LLLAVSAKDAQRAVVDEVRNLGPIPQNTPYRVELTSDIPTVKTGDVDFISCT
jgi:hypothetical protein